MEAITSAVINKALDSLSMRYEYIAQNISNANSTDYLPVRVSFEENLRSAASKNVEAINAVNPKLTYIDNNSTGTGLRLDMELASAAQTAMRYNALINILGRQMSLARSVVRGGQ